MKNKTQYHYLEMAYNNLEKAIKQKEYDKNDNNFYESLLTAEALLCVCLMILKKNTKYNNSPLVKLYGGDGIVV